MKSGSDGYAVFRMLSVDQGLHLSAPVRYSRSSWKSTFNVDPGFAYGCRGMIVNFISGYGEDAIFLNREMPSKS